MNQKLATWFAVLTLVTLFGFPKAGFYVGNIPLTFSYVCVGVAALFELICLTRSPNRKFGARYAWLGFLVGTLAVVELASFKIYGMKSLGMTVSVLTSTLLLPVLTLLMTHWLLRILSIDGVLASLRWALIPVFVFGMISFAAYNTTGVVLGVPFLTTTGSDISMVAERHNLRGPIIKMFSTYNNGNILGINLILWGPIVSIGAARCAVGYRSLCVLTLSRSVWAGLIAFQLFSAIVHRSRQKVYQSILAVAILGAAGVFASLAIGRNPVEFLLDKDLGGRVTSLQNDLEVISSLRIGWDSESVPAAAWLAFGPIGLTLLFAAWLIPIVTGGKSEVQITARISLAVYLLVSVVEGAFVLIPTQAVYWFVAAIAMTSLSTEPQTDAVDQDVQEDPTSEHRELGSSKVRQRVRESRLPESASTQRRLHPEPASIQVSATEPDATPLAAFDSINV